MYLSLGLWAVWFLTGNSANKQDLVWVYLSSLNNLRDHGKSVLRCLYIAAKNLFLYGEYEWGICKSANDCCAHFSAEREDIKCKRLYFPRLFTDWIYITTFLNILSQLTCHFIYSDLKKAVLMAWGRIFQVLQTESIQRSKWGHSIDLQYFIYSLL